MSRRWRAVLTACAAPCTLACAVIFPGHPASEFKAKERVTLTLVETSNGAKTCTIDSAVAGAFPAAAILAPIAVDLILKGVGTALEEEAGRYQASYASVASGRFFEEPPKLDGQQVSARLRLAGFTLERTARKRDGTLVFGARQVGTSRFVFAVEPSACGDAYEILLTDVRLARSKAKVFHPNWEDRWWTRIPLVYGFAYDLLNLLGVIDWGDGAVDLVVALEMDAVWIDGKGGHRETVARFETKIPDAPLGSCKLDDCPNLVENRNLRTGWLPAIPVSRLGDHQWGHGNFVLSVKVTEADDFGDTVQMSADKLAENREKLKEQIVKVVVEASDGAGSGSAPPGFGSGP